MHSTLCCRLSEKYHENTLVRCEIMNQVALKIDKKMKAPVFLYYKLTNFFQNHRRYVKSRSDEQLRGTSINTYEGLQECTPMISKGDQSDPDDLYYPCGLIAYSLFNDTILMNDPAVRVDNDHL